MKKGALVIICVFLLFIFFIAPLLTADELVLNLESRILDSFDDTTTSKWIAKGSKYVTQGYPKVAFADTWPEALFGVNRDNKQLKVLGVNFKFDRQGYNAVEIMPVNASNEPTTIKIPGIVKTLDIWVWGSNFKYDFEVHLMDHTGVVHVLKFGQLDYKGWKNLRVEIPRYIPQSAVHVPKYKGLELIKFVIWTRPQEKVDNCYIYFDQIKVLTDVFNTRFDGDDLATPDTMNKVWGASTTGGGN